MDLDLAASSSFRAVTHRMALDKYAPLARSIIFVVDSFGVKHNVKDVAEYLYDVLALPQLKACPILILCNKEVREKQSARDPM